MSKTIITLSLLFVSCLSVSANTSLKSDATKTKKPNIYVFSDLSDPTVRRTGGHPTNDPDDIVSLASLLLHANHFNIVNIVVGSTNRKNLVDPMPFVEGSFLQAYQHDLKYLKEISPHFPDAISVTWSNITQSSMPIKFSAQQSYKNIESLDSVKTLIDFAKSNKVYVLSWGPLTESAIAVKHLLDTNDTDTLENLLFISHWTKSSINQGTPETPFDVANCRDDKQACDYLHLQAKKSPHVNFVELGSVGQTGIVNGSKPFADNALFDGSRLGQIFNRAKYYYGKQDQSDAATFWVLFNQVAGANTLNIDLQDYPHNGELSKSLEIVNRDKFFASAGTIMQSLQSKTRFIHDKADKQLFSQQQITEWFTYVYKKGNKYEFVAPYDGMQYQAKNLSTKQTYSGQLKRGNQFIDIPLLTENSYKVSISYNGNVLTLML